MPKYRFKGNYNFAPDRGSPHGDKQPVSFEFVADDDELAKEHVAEWREGKVEVVDESLIRIDVPEKTTPIKLA